MRTCSNAVIRRASVAVATSLLLVGFAGGCGSDASSSPDAPVLTGKDGSPAEPLVDAPIVSGTEVGDLATDQASAAFDVGTGVDVAAIDGARAPNVDGGPSGLDGGIDGAGLPACSSLVNPLYIMSGDTQVPVLKALGKALRQSANPMTLVWYATGSCTIIDALYNGTPLKQTPSYIPDDPAWDASSGAVPSCALESSGHAIDVGIPIVFPESCTTTPAPAGLAAFKGPVQSMIFVVPHSASPEAISSEQARLVFGTGSTANVLPWTDENFYFIRPATKGTQVSLGALIGVPAAQWHGQQINLSPDLATKVASSTSPEKTIGILGSEILDTGTNRTTIKTLAFQTVGQTNGFLPDSTATAFDKRNVRDGHYAAWAHVIYLTKVTGADGGAPSPVNADAKLMIDILTDTANPAVPASIDPVTVVSQKGLVPLCAMTVTRSSEGGSLSLSSPSDPCGCYYENLVGKAPATCVACSVAAPCAAAGTTCRHGFCEADDGRTSLSDCSALPATATHAQLINNTCTAGARFTSDPI
jgi:hypothetical protein